VYQLDDLVFNRTEAHYDTGLVAGLVSIAVAIGDYETSEVSGEFRNRFFSSLV